MNTLKLIEQKNGKYVVYIDDEVVGILNSIKPGDIVGLLHQLYEMGYVQAKADLREWINNEQ